VIAEISAAKKLGFVRHSMFRVLRFVADLFPFLLGRDLRNRSAKPL
jgi:hypothetical protein